MMKDVAFPLPGDVTAPMEQIRSRGWDAGLCQFGNASVVGNQQKRATARLIGDWRKL